MSRRPTTTGGGTPPKAQVKGPDHLTSDLWPIAHAYPVLAGKDCGRER
jgi:hypothetical protein